MIKKFIITITIFGTGHAMQFNSTSPLSRWDILRSKLPATSDDREIKRRRSIEFRKEESLLREAILRNYFKNNNRGQIGVALMFSQRLHNDLHQLELI